MGYTVRVTNVSLVASERDIYDFFAFSGEISSIETKPTPGDPNTQEAYVTFEEERSLETAMLLTGAVIGDKAVTVEVMEGYVPPPSSAARTYASQFSPQPGTTGATGFDTAESSTVRKAEDTIAGLLANGYILGKDAMAKAQEYDERHALSTTLKDKAASFHRSATQTAAELDEKYAISQKLAETSASVTRSVTRVDEKYQVSSKTREALTAAEQSIAEAGQYVMQNKYVQSSSAWLAGAFGQLKTMVNDVQQQTSVKVQKAEEERVLGQRGEYSAVLDDHHLLTHSDPAAKPTALGLTDHGPPVASTHVDAPSTAPAPAPAPGPAPAPAPAPAASLMDAPLAAPPSSAASTTTPRSVDPPLF